MNTSKTRQLTAMFVLNSLKLANRKNSVPFMNGGNRNFLLLSSIINIKNVEKARKNKKEESSGTRDFLFKKS